MKHIVFLLDQLYPCVNGGVELFHYYFTQFLSQNFDVKVTVITNCNALKQYESENLTVVVNHARLFGKASLSAFYHHISFAIINRKNINLIYTPYDSKSWYAPYHLMFLNLFFAIPYVLRISGGKMHPERPSFLHKMLFRFSTGRITVSTPMKEEYERRHKRDIKLIPSMLPFNESEKSKSNIRNSFGIKTNRIVLLFVGTIKEIKGPDLLLNAFISLGINFIENNRLHLVYAGNGPMLHEIKASAKEKELSKHVTFLGHVQHKKICDVYKASDIFIIPSLMEARPLSLSEALFNGLSVIGSDIPTIKNIIANGSNGLLFKTGSSNHLAVKIKQMATDCNFRIFLGRNAKKNYRTNFSYKSMVDKYYKYFLDCV